MSQQQEEGWPLGLRLLNARVGFERNRGLSVSADSFTTLFSNSSISSTTSSSDLDSQPTGSFFLNKRSITLGRILEMSQRSGRGRQFEEFVDKRNCKFLKPWLYSLCSKLRTDAVTISNAPPSLGYFLESERTRRATSNSNFQMSRRQIMYEADDILPAPVQPAFGPNSLFPSSSP